jgi:exodeoxyribonuclease VII large subunit
LQSFETSLPRQVQRGLEGVRHRLERAALRLDLLDPTLVLQRGYAWVSDSHGKAVTRVRELVVGQSLQVHLTDGQAGVMVTERHEKGPR